MRQWHLTGVVVWAAVAVGGVLLAAAHPISAADTVVGIDADPAGNSATTLGPADSCVAVASGDTFEIDIYIKDVQDLLAWSVYLETDGAIVRVVDRDVDQFLASASGSDVFDGSLQTPDDDGLYPLAAVDTADPPAPEGGSGVLARVTLEALGPGVSPLRLAHNDIDGDDKVDQGTLLQNTDAQNIGDDDGDTFYDGDVDEARVAVDSACGAATSNDDDDGGGGRWIIVAIAVGIAALMVIVQGALVIRRRRSRA